MLVTFLEVKSMLGSYSSISTNNLKYTISSKQSKDDGWSKSTIDYCPKLIQQPGCI